MGDNVGSGHSDTDGRILVSEFLATAAIQVPMRPTGVGQEGEAVINSILSRLSPPDRVALLRAAVEGLPDLRRSNAANANRHGTVLYAAVCALYRARLPLGEDDLCHLLVTARHNCGHGADTRPPFDLARTYMRKHGYSPSIGAAIRAFVANLPASSAVKVRELRRSASLIAVLGREGTVPDGTWIGDVHLGLARLAGPERRVWERLVLAMSVSERMVMPNTWRRPVESAINELGPDVVLRRFDTWWPRADVVMLGDGGGQLLKHLIWMLELLPRTDSERLVAHLADVRFKGRREPLAVLKPAGAFLLT